MKKAPSIHTLMRERLLARAGIFPPAQRVISAKDVERFYHTEWSPDFERLRLNRMVMGAVRYGSMHGNSDEPFDRVKKMIDKLEAYKKNGNAELLVDVANYAMLTFLFDKHALKHFEATDDQDHQELKAGVGR